MLYPQLSTFQMSLPNLGATNLADVGCCIQKLYFGGMDHGGRGLACRQRFRRVIGLLMCHWLRLWPGDLLDQAGLFTGYCFLRGFFNSFSKGGMILGNLNFQSVSRMGRGVG